MLNIKRVYGANFCQHPSFNYTLGPGLTCVMGMNGSGKSNFVRALYLCLCGEVYGPGNLVRDGRTTGFVAMDVEADRGTFTIRRELKRNVKTGGTSIKHILNACWLDDGMSKKNDITAFMSNWLGGTSSVLEYVTFARQYKFEELITADHIVRAKMLNALMGYSRAEKLREVLQKQRRRIADMPDRTQLIGMTQNDIEDLIGQKEAAESKIPEVSAEYEQLYKFALQVKDKVLDTAKRAQLNTCNAKLAEAEEDLRKACVVRSTLKDPGDIPIPDENAYACFQKYESDKELYESAKQNLQVLAPPPDDPGITDEMLIEKQQVITEKNVEVSKLNEQIRSAGDGVCPTCKRLYDEQVDTTALIAEATAITEEIRTLSTALEELRREKTRYERSSAEHTTMLNNLKSSVALHRKNMEDYAGFADFNVEDHMAQREAYNNLVKLQNAIAAADSEIQRNTHVVEVQKLEIARLEGLDAVSPEEKQQAIETVNAYETLNKVREAGRAAVSSLEAQITAKKARLAELEKDQADGATNRKVAELLEFARDQLHAERLPKLAARSYINAINSSMSKYLSMFSFAYPFYLNEDLDFVVDWDGQTGVDAEVLSGGEMVRAAIAMRFALMEVFRAGCGMLVVDEPTTGQDEDARTALVEVLTLAACHFRDQNIKIICPTHARELAAAADAIITIGE